MKERRATRRFFCDANVELEGAGGERLLGHATDVSMHGVGVQLGAEVLDMLGLTQMGGLLDPNAPRLRVRIDLREDASSEALALRGVPLHVRRLSRAHYRLGVRLVFENTGQKEALQEWVDRLQGSSDGRDG